MNDKSKGNEDYKARIDFITKQRDALYNKSVSYNSKLYVAERKAEKAERTTKLLTATVQQLQDIITAQGSES